jgi:integrase
MPKPHFLRRPSGLYVRFLIPSDCRPAIGSRFVVRSLGTLRGDAARLAAARVGYALAHVFVNIREGHTMGTYEDYLKSLTKFEMDLDPSTGQVTRLKTDNTPQDNESMLKALAMLRQPAQHVAPVPSPIAAPMLADRIDLFLTQFRQKRRAAGNVLDTAHSMYLLLGFVGDKPLASVGATDMDQVLAGIGAWPPNATKKAEFAGLSPAQVVKKAARLGSPTIGERTQEKHLDSVRKFFNWAVERGEIPRNPAKTLHVLTRDQEDARSRRAFTIDEVRKLFHMKVRRDHCAGHPVKWFLPLMALYSGARAQELAQLWTDDLATVNYADGTRQVTGFHIATRHPGQRVKNRASRRFVPLHPALLRANLLGYRDDVVAQFGAGPLFPSAVALTAAGDALGDWFNRAYLRIACEITDPSVVFHCFRHTFATTAANLGIPEAHIARITGHSSGGSILNDHYIDPPTLGDRVATVEKVTYLMPQIEPYTSGQFAEYFEGLKHRRKVAEARAARAARAKKSPPRRTKKAPPGTA